MASILGVLAPRVNRRHRSYVWFLDLVQKLEHDLKRRLPEDEYLPVPIGQDTLVQLMPYFDIDGGFHRFNMPGERIDIDDRESDTTIGDLAEKEDPLLWGRIEQLRQGLPALTGQRAADV